jgi:hypothetical protein
MITAETITISAIVVFVITLILCGICAEVNDHVPSWLLVVLLISLVFIIGGAVAVLQKDV